MVRTCKPLISLAAFFSPYRALTRSEQQVNWDSVDGFMGQHPLQYAGAPSLSGQSESETATVGYTEDGAISGAEDDAQPPQRRRKARMNEVDEATQLVSQLARSLLEENSISPNPASTSTEQRLPASLSSP
jgi:hypothetical protein